MNREILFRGKRIDNSEWVEGYFNKWPCVSWKELSCVIVPVIGLENGIAEQFIVDPATVGQFTGLTDKSGKRIFEGDLITTAWWHGHVAKVVFKNGMFKAEYNPLFSWVANETYEIAVVGNVWDNPELLEGE